MLKRKAVLVIMCLVLLCFGIAGVSFAAEKTHTNSIDMEFVLIPAGSFIMGKGTTYMDSEFPQHKVTISKPFYMGKYEVTQAQWEAVMGNNPSKFKGRNNPVENISWLDAQKFIKRLNQKEGHARYRLPTEAEWEYAARAGTGSMYFFGDDENMLVEYGWCWDNSSGTEASRPVGLKPANAWGLHDVHGNVWEFVQDWYGDDYYTSSPETDPQGPASGTNRVARGGSWKFDPVDCRSGSRTRRTLDRRHIDVGFRLALSQE